MPELTTEQLVYLLYASAYTESDTAAKNLNTVTKSTVKPYLQSKWRGKAENIYDSLLTQGLIKQRSKGRFSVTEPGLEALVANLATTDYRFEAAKGQKVLNTLLNCIKKAAKAHSESKSFDVMSFDEFQEKFRLLYFEERKRQELSGIVAIHKKELFGSFQNTNSAVLSPEMLNKYFEELRSTGTVFTSKGEEDELIHWVE
ncbi:hypothetical protein ACKFKG_32825 [Phormidesmis sp. 146-35]